MRNNKILTIIFSIVLVLSLTSCSKTGDFSIFVFSSLFLNFDRPVSFNSSKLEEGDVIKLGYYNSKPLEWIVLQIDDKKMLVLSKYGLFGDDNDHRVFGDTLEKEYTWEDSSIREYLNSEDLLWKLFTENEQALILDTKIETDDNPFYGVDGGKNTTDKLFLLSVFDIVENFKSIKDTKCTQPNGERCAWWLRTPGDAEWKTTYIDSEGHLDTKGIGVSSYTTPGTMDTYSVMTVRPAMWIALDNKSIRVNNDYEDYEEEYFDDSIGFASGAGSGNSSAIIPPKTISVGSTVSIGAIDNHALEWMVLEISGDKALVLCNCGIAYTYLNATDRVYSWETCDVRKNMNSDDFLNMLFSPSEQELILQTTISNKDNPDYGTSGGNSTKDKLFLLSADEVLTFFKSPSQTRCQAGLFIQQDQYFDWYWWLRTPGMNDNMASIVTPDGIVNTGGAYANDPNALIRPAMWIKIK